MILGLLRVREDMSGAAVAIVFRFGCSCRILIGIIRILCFIGFLVIFVRHFVGVFFYLTASAELYVL